MLGNGRPITTVSEIWTSPDLKILKVSIVTTLSMCVLGVLQGDSQVPRIF